MRGQSARTIGRVLGFLAAAAVSGVAVLAFAVPGRAAPAIPGTPAVTLTAARSTAAVQAAAKAKFWEASGYTGPQVHATWAGPDVGFLAWTVGLSMTAFKDNAFRSCRSNWTGVSIDVSWNSESLHNGAQLVIMDSVKLSNGKWRDVGPALTISKPVAWPGHPAFGGQYHAVVYTPGNVHVVQAHIESWISNGGVPYQDPTGSGDTVTLKQARRC
jgi:hypothetical protein